MLIEKSICSLILIITLIATPVIGQQKVSNGPAIQNKEKKGLELRNYAYELRTIEAKITPTTVLVVKANYSNEDKSCPQFEELFKEYGLSPVKTFSYIAYRESRCRPKAVNAKWDKNGNVTWTLNNNGSIDRGLFQINSSWRTVTSNVCGSKEGDMDVLYNLDCNLRVAKYLLDNGGLGHWGM